MTDLSDDLVYLPGHNVVSQLEDHLFPIGLHIVSCLVALIAQLAVVVVVVMIALLQRKLLIFIVLVNTGAASPMILTVLNYQFLH